ncbi:MAG: helix-turn-helix domain-containing protein [Candidatus Aenigmarchaeota archaeon]|nr:helix-turn-helix domain-containing protein [Candidatus Aenigmarchaeota archaeon]
MTKQKPQEIALQTLVEELKRELYPILSTPKRWLNEEQAARYLGISKYTLQKWRRPGNPGPRFYKVGARILYELQDLDFWVKAQKNYGAEKQ